MTATAGTELWALERRASLALRPADFAVTRVVPTRWRDNDMYGHINNALYYEFFDTAINGWLLEQLPESPAWTATRMFVAESACRYLAELAFPSPLMLALRVARVGGSSVTYELGIFAMAGDDPGPIAALGRWVHVFVNAGTRAPTPIPDDVRALLATAADPVPATQAVPAHQEENA